MLGSRRMQHDRFALVFAALLASGCGAATRPDGGSGPLAVGTPAPDLRAVDQAGKSHSVGEAKGHALLVYFYPKDGTPGCTKEACAFRDAWDKFEKAGVT